MKGMKGKLFKKLKSVKQISYNPDRILQQVSSFDGFVDKFQLKSTLVDNFPFKSHNKPQSTSSKSKLNPTKEVINVEELIKDLQEDEDEEEINTHCDINEKENIYPSKTSKDPVIKSKNPNSNSNTFDGEERKGKEKFFPLSTAKDPVIESNNSNSNSYSSSIDGEEKKGNSEIKRSSFSSDLRIDVESFRRPDMNSSCLFDPNLLAAFEEALKTTMAAANNLETSSKNHKYPFFQPEDQPDPLTESDEQGDPLADFEPKCPPGGGDSVIFYTTSLRGIRKTFEDCQSIRFLLESFGLIYYERDVSIHSGFRDEMWKVMGEKCLPPRLFVRGRYIGGAEKVLTLHEQGRLRPLFRDIPINFSEGPCNVCSGLRFILCYNCNGSRKVFEHHDDDGDDQEGSHGGGGLWSKCSQCNENGLIVCPLC